MGKGSSNKTSGKVRFDGIDVFAMVSHLQRTLLGRRVINIYDGVSDGDAFLFKFDGSGGGGSEEGSSGRSLLFLESGIRFHTTTKTGLQQQQEAGRMPSPFCSKLRKHLRGLRLERVVQLGNYDRVVDFVFGTGTSRHSLLLELYARGNVLLTNASYEILALLRSHEYADQDVQVRVGHVYPVTFATTSHVMGSSNNNPEVNQQEDATVDDDHDARASSPRSNGILSLNGSDAQQWALAQLAPRIEEATMDEKKPETKKGGKKKDSSIPLKALLLKPTSGVYHYGPALIEHCILCADLDPNVKLTEKSLEETLPVSAWESLVTSLREEGSRVTERLRTEEVAGYILYRPKTKDTTEPVGGSVDTTTTTPQHADKVLEEFQPHLLKQHEGRLSLPYDTFAEAVDDFFFHIGSQKQSLRAEAAETAAREKLQKIRKDQERRVETLVREQEKLNEHARLVQLHADNVDKALSVINSALDTGMDWEALEQLVKVEQENQNPIALLIKHLDLDKDAMVLSLPDTLFGDDEDNVKSVDITVSLHESAYGNVREMFDAYRAAKEKSQKTVEASTKAMKAAEATAQRQLAEAQKRTKLSASLQQQRKSHWFEKFHWFITSDNYLVLGGRDAQQNEMLVKRYLRPGDAYLHADVHGASSCILRAKRRRRPGGKTEVLPLSDQALREAGNFTICLSSAWPSRIVTSAWWVEPSQVSKTAPTGEYLTVGSFMVRGKKNFLPPTQLEMGLAVLFRLGDDDSIARHRNERRDFALLESDDVAQEEDYAENTVEEAEESIKPSVTVDDAGSDDKMPATSKEKTDAAGKISDSGDSIVNSADATDIELDKGTQTSRDLAAQSGEDQEGLLGEKQEQHATAKVNLEGTDDAIDESSEAPVSSNTQTDPIVKTDASEAAVEAPKKTQKKGLSVRDRKLIKRYGSLEAAEKAAAERDRNKQNNVDLEDETNIATQTVASGAATGETQPKLKRGKKSKMKRAAKKYDHQDDEDRELAMLALHGGEKRAEKKNGKRVMTSSESQQKASADAAKLLVKDSSQVVEQLPPSVQKALATCVSVKTPDATEIVVRWDKFDADVLEQVVALGSEEKQLAAANRLLYLKQSTRVDNFSASLAGIVRTIKKYGHENLETEVDIATTNTADGAKRKTKAEKVKEKEAWREALAEEGILDDDAGEGEVTVDDTAELSKLTGKPHPDDALLYAIPVCAPYQTLSQYKYKVKLTPGQQKRGKAAKQCVEMFLKGGNDKSPSSDRNRELIKRVGDNDWVQAICANVKISAPGASKMSKKQKAGNKKSGKKK